MERGDLGDHMNHMKSLGPKDKVMLDVVCANDGFNFVKAARQLEYFKGKSALGPKIDSLAEALAIVQHHDAITGTEKQHITDDYSKRLSIGYIKLQ
ncbi:hypothetical protein Fmac_027208 [Flemingia macrophylla]|uniref:Glycoside hydrolase family 38 central domain-containing protein n=1 Tax=Flemingia macrophylla TaxID=520843 RepID=A0ABD1LH22_9FABA